MNQELKNIDIKSEFEERNRQIKNLKEEKDKLENQLQALENHNIKTQK